MKRWLKRIRGVFGTALTWAAAWSGVGAIVRLVGGSFGVVDASFGVVDVFVDYVVTAGVFAILGFVGGGAFSVVLGIAEGRRRFDEMSLPRFAAWGAIPAFVLFALLGGFGGGLLGGMVYGSVVALLGAGSAAGSLALARRVDDRELLEHGAEVADIGLTEEEKRDLLAG